jgi:hypothetical protein
VERVWSFLPSPCRTLPLPPPLTPCEHEHLRGSEGKVVSKTSNLSILTSSSTTLSTPSSTPTTARARRHRGSQLRDPDSTPDPKISSSTDSETQL